MIHVESIILTTINMFHPPSHVRSWTSVASKAHTTPKPRMKLKYAINHRHIRDLERNNVSRTKSEIKGKVITSDTRHHVNCNTTMFASLRAIIRNVSNFFKTGGNFIMMTVGIEFENCVISNVCGMENSKL